MEGMLMEYKLHHFAIICEDFDKSLAYYRDQLGNQVASRWQNKGFFNLAFVGNGGEGTVELIGKPYIDYEEEHIAKHGYSINHISFLVEDVDAAFEELKAQGVKVAWEPQQVLSMRQCGFFDEDGLLFEVFSYMSPIPLASPDLSKPLGPTDIYLHHISILTPELRRSQKFYEEKLGFKTVFEYTEDDGGFIFLIDSTYNHKTNNFMLEIIGPPNLEPREEKMLAKRGACYDHFCYTAVDVNGAWKAALERGAKNLADPVHEYGMEIAWVYDQDGNDVEIMNPIPEEIVDIVLQGGEPLNGMQM
jgi:catechol 2,3-dioxygenase-like lactoylglutathione lyase family enzyme